MLGSLWEATATSPTDAPPLESPIEAPVAIIGAGIAGLSVAIALADRGTQSVVLDRFQPGWGASGRNGGIVVPAVKLGPAALAERLGAEAGARLHAFAGAAPRAVFDLIDRFAIDCDPARKGWLVAAHSRNAADSLRQRVVEQAAAGDPVEFLEVDEMATLTGSPAYHGGLIDRRGGHLQPLSYTRGLAGAAVSLGVQVFGDSPVERFERRTDGWRLTAGAGAVTAEHVVVATNGYTGSLTPALSKTMVAVHSLMVATEPGVTDEVLPQGHAVSDSRRVLWYFRKDRDGRLAFGGRGMLAEPRGAEDYIRIMEGVRGVFPQLESVRFDHHWGGRVAVNRPHLPQIHRPTPGMTTVMGFNGRGVAFATAIGPAVADIVLGADPEDVSPLPVTRPPVIPLHGLQGVYASLGTRWYQLLDRLS